MPRQWKRGGGGGEGYLDNRAGDRSTMTAVFSIRHYLIDRVAGLIVRGGYFRAAFVWGSAPVPQPSSTPDTRNPTPFALMSPQRPCYLVRSAVQSLSLLGGSLFAFYQQRAKSVWTHEPRWKKTLAGPSEPVQPTRVSRLRWDFRLLPIGSHAHCRYLLNRVIVVFVHVQGDICKTWLTLASRNASAVLFCCIRRMRHRKRGCCGRSVSQK